MGIGSNFHYFSHLNSNGFFFFFFWENRNLIYVVHRLNLVPYKPNAKIHIFSYLVIKKKY